MYEFENVQVNLRSGVEMQGGKAEETALAKALAEDQQLEARRWVINLGNES